MNRKSRNKFGVHKEVTTKHHLCVYVLLLYLMEYTEQFTGQLTEFEWSLLLFM